jgi:hypothetical protein
MDTNSYSLTYSKNIKKQILLALRLNGEKLMAKECKPLLTGLFIWKPIPTSHGFLL